MDVIAGTGHPGVHDGKGASANFYQVASICTEFVFLYITDAQAGIVRLVTSGRAMTEYLQHVGIISIYTWDPCHK